MRISFYFIFKAVILLLFLDSMYLWVTWNVPTHYIGFFVTIVMIFYILVDKIKLKVTKGRLIGGGLLIVSFLIGYSLSNLGAVLGPFFVVFPCLLLFFIDDPQIAKDILDFTANFFAVIFPISLFLFLFSFIGLPSLGKISHPSGIYGSSYNYIFALYSEFYGIRFVSVFLEPGHLGMILAYLLYALKFNFRDIRVLIIFVSSLFTLSLAAYVLIGIGYVLNLFAFKKLKLQVVIIGSIGILLLYLVAINYNEGNNLVNERLFERLQPSEEKGISGNNRTYGLLDDFYEVVVEHKDLVLWGIGVENYNFIKENYNFGGAGYKIYLLRQGLVSLILVLLAYLLLGFSISQNRRYVLGFFLIILFSFIQRAYPFWASWLIPFYAGIKELELKKMNK